MKKIISFVLFLSVVLSLFSVWVPARAATVWGIDVSEWQGNINWTSVKNSGVQFAILRAWCWDKDNCFETNYANATAAGVPVGAYSYIYADTIAEAQAEAQSLINTLNDANGNGRPFQYPIFIDVEHADNYAALDNTFVAQIVKTEMDMLKAAGYYPAFYSYTSFVNSYVDMSTLSDYDFWVADYRSSLGYTGDYTMWQYSDKGSVSGISGNVDMNYCYVDYPAQIAASGLNFVGGNLAEGYPVDSDTYMINDGESADGWKFFAEGDAGATVGTHRTHSQGNSSFMMNYDTPTKYGETGCMARCTYKEAMDLTTYKTITFDYYISHDFVGQEGELQLNFCTDNGDDGFNFLWSIKGLEAGWHTKSVVRERIPMSQTADWSRITHLRFTWWNKNGRTEKVTFLLDNLRACNTSAGRVPSYTPPAAGEAQPGGNVLKVTYDNSDATQPGYKYLDLADTTWYLGYKLAYDVYLADDQAGIGNLELDDKYGNCARDDRNFKDQNGVAGHPKTDISDLAYGKWYHRELTIPGHWDGKGYAKFYTMIAFDGGFTGSATAYFDNIKILDGQGKVVEWFFRDGGEEYSYVNDVAVTAGFTYDVTNYNGVNAQVIPIGDMEPVPDDTKPDNPIPDDPKPDDPIPDDPKPDDPTPAPKTAEEVREMVQSLPKFYEIGEEDRQAVLEIRTAYEGLSEEDKASVDNIPLLLSCEARLEGLAGRLMYGDLNLDGEVGAVDALKVLQYSVRLIDLDTNEFEAGRVGGGEDLSASDALLILQKTVLLIDSFPVEAE